MDLLTDAMDYEKSILIFCALVKPFQGKTTGSFLSKKEKTRIFIIEIEWVPYRQTYSGTGRDMRSWDKRRRKPAYTAAKTESRIGFILPAAGSEKKRLAGPKNERRKREENYGKNRFYPLEGHAFS